MPIAIATSSSSNSYKLKTTNHQAFFSLFNSITTGDEVKMGKPDPEIFLKCLKKFELKDPAKTIVFEDSLNGVIAAVNAGMYCVWVVDRRFTPDSLHVPDEISSSGKMCKLNSLKDFKWSLIGKEDINV